MNFQRCLHEPAADPTPVRSLGQYFTPPWLANAIVDRYFGWLGTDDVVCEPSCGLGAFLNALPTDVTAYGVEVDGALADRCRALTDRQVIVGHFESAPLPSRPTAILGNPPFATRVIEAFLDRSHALLPRDGVAGFILPAYFLQTAGRVVEYARRWSMETELIPRNVYPDLSKPLVFTLFRKNAGRRMVGMAFYFEAAAVAQLPEEIKTLFSEQGAPLWPRVVERALIALGGRGTLQQIYRAVEGNRPSNTPFWREQIRKVLQQRFRKVGTGEWAHPSAALLASAARARGGCGEPLPSQGCCGCRPA